MEMTAGTMAELGVAAMVIVFLFKENRRLHAKIDELIEKLLETADGKD